MTDRYRRLLRGTPERHAPTAGAFATEARALRSWVAALPLANFNATTKLLLDGLRQINRMKVDAVQRNNQNALMWAAASGSLPTVELLLQRGADASARDDRGKTALDIATDEHQPEIASRLRAGSGNQGDSAGP